MKRQGSAKKAGPCEGEGLINLVCLWIPKCSFQAANLQPATDTLCGSNLPWSPAAACMTRDTLCWLQKDGREGTLR